MDEDLGVLGAVRDGDALHLNGVVQVVVGRAGHEHGAGHTGTHALERHKDGVCREKKKKAS